MEYIISSIFAALFSITFLIWGLYQIKTGKMVAKNAKNPIDEPKEVGAIFMFIAIVGLCLAILLFSSAPNVSLSPYFQSLALIISASLCMLVFVAMAIVSFRGLIRGSIFGVKLTKKTKKPIKKYAIPANLSLLLFSVLLPASLIGNNFLDLGIFAGVLGLLSVLCFGIFALCMILISKNSK